MIPGRNHLVSLAEGFQGIKNALEKRSLGILETFREQRCLSESHKHTSVSLLPDEVLRNIFLHCLPTQNISPMRPEHAPILLCHVCFQWRDIALGTPALWNSLHTYPYKDDKPHSYPSEERLIERDSLLTQWVARSGALPLSISFEPVIPVMTRPLAIDQSNTVDLLRLLRLLLPYCERWDSLDVIFAGRSDDILPFLDGPEWAERNPLGRITRLRLGISLNVNEYMDLCGGQKMSMALDRCIPTAKSRLRELSLWHNGFQVPLIDHLPCSRLQVLEYQCPLESPYTPWPLLSYNALLAILRKSPAIASLSAKCARDPFTSPRGPPDDGSKIFNPQLRRLSLSFLTFDDMFEDHVIDAIHWPVLASLALRPLMEGRMELGPAETSHHVRLIRKLGSTLTSLTISSKLEVWKILEHLPILVHLHLETRTDDDFLKYENPEDSEEEYFKRLKTSATTTILLLTPRLGESHACQSLQHLVWEGYTFFEDDELLALVLNRGSHTLDSVPLKQIHITFSRERSIDIIPRCSDLIARGLDICLTYPSPEDLSSQWD